MERPHPINPNPTHIFNKNMSYQLNSPSRRRRVTVLIDTKSQSFESVSQYVEHRNLNFINFYTKEEKYFKLLKGLDQVWIVMEIYRYWDFWIFRF